MSDAGTDDAIRPRGVGDFFAPFFRVAFKSIDAGQDLTSAAANASAAAAAATGTPAAASLEAIALSLQSTVAAVENAQLDAFANDPEFEMTIDSRNLAYYASNLTIDFKGGAPGEFTLTLTPPYDDAVRIIDKRLIQWGSLVKVQWGYISAAASRNLLSKVHLFVCNKPQLAMNGNDYVITIAGNDVFADSAMRNQTREPWKRETYKTDLDIVREVVSRIGKLEIDETLLPADALLRLVKTEPAAQTSSDWLFLRELCFDNLVGMHVEAGKLRLYDMRSVAQQPATYNLLWRIAPTTDHDIPMMSFTGNSDMRAFMPPEAISVLDLAVNTNSNAPVARDLTAPSLANNPHLGTPPTATSAAGRAGNTGQTTTDKQSGAGFNTRPKQRAQDAGVVLPRPFHVNNGDVVAERLAREAEYWANTKATATAPGFPDLLPMQVVQVYGAGRSFSGPYFVQATRHELGLDGYTMHLELIRNIDDVSDGETPQNPATSPPVADGTTAPTQEGK